MESAGQRAYDDVKNRILQGELEGGALLSEGDIAERLGISRTPVREAFLRLQAEGWMRLYPKRGAVITPIGRGEAGEVIEARTLLELHAVERATSDAERTARLVAALSDALETQRRAAERHDTAAYAAADADFHSEIVAAGGNRLLRGFYATLRDRQLRMVARSVPVETSSAARIQHVIGQHIELLEAIRARDAARFGELLRAHLTEIHRDLLG